MRRRREAQCPRRLTPTQIMRCRLEAKRPRWLAPSGITRHQCEAKRMWRLGPIGMMRRRRKAKCPRRFRLIGIMQRRCEAKRMWRLGSIGMMRRRCRCGVKPLRLRCRGESVKKRELSPREAIKTHSKLRPRGRSTSCPSLAAQFLARILSGMKGEVRDAPRTRDSLRRPRSAALGARRIVVVGYRQTPSANALSLTACAAG